VAKTAQQDPIIIKKYANRRLYNTATSSYVTLDHLSAMVKEKQNFQVIDAKTGEDITRSVLTQIIVEEENKGQNLLPIQFLRQLIGFYGNSMESFLPSYLEMSLEQFAQNQEKFQQTLTGALGASPPFQKYEEQIRQNMSMFQQAMDMFSPFAKTASKNQEADKKSSPSTAKPGNLQNGDSELDTLKSQMEAMQDKLNELTKKS